MNKFIQFKTKRQKNNIILAFKTIIVALAVVTLSFGEVYASQVNGSPINLAQLIKEKTVTLNITKSSLRGILEEIRKQTGVGFAISEDVKKLPNVTIKADGESIQSVLDKILKGTGLHYSVLSDSIIISKAPQKEEEPEKGKVIEVTGQVVDEDKNPIVGAVVYVQTPSVANYQGRGTITDDDGNFKLSLPVGSVMMTSFMGYKDVQWTVKANDADKKKVIELKIDDTDIGNVVVTGVFQKARESYTGAVKTISSKELQAFKGQNLLQTLRNVDPALNIVYDNALGSNPNAMPNVSIRGNSSLPSNLNDLEAGVNAQLNTPLIILDGFEITLDRLVDMQDEDILAINILKDASATALYGSKGANGVIVITTKAPRAGELRIRFNASISAEIPDLTSYNMLSAQEKFDLENKMGVYKDDNGSDWEDQDKYYNAIAQNLVRGVNTDWLAQPLQTGIGQNYNLSLEGGSDQFRWAANVDYNHISGAMKGSSRKNFAGSIKLSYTYKDIIFTNNTQIMNNVADESPYGNFQDYVNMNPYWAINDDNGNLITNYLYQGGGSKGIANPLYNAQLNSIDRTSYMEVLNNFAAEWNITEDLKLRGALGISHRSTTDEMFIPKEHTDFDSSSISPLLKGQYDYGVGAQMNVQGNVTAAYSKIFAEKHQLYAGVDFSISNRESYNHNFVTMGFPNENLTFPTAAASYADASPNGSEDILRSMGVTANVNYSFDNRIFADATWRYEGSSAFGSNNRFAPFWNVGAGWNIHNEKFMENTKWVSNLRLKGSYGVVGSQQFSAYQALQTLRYDVSRPYGEGIAAVILGYGNPNLRWQTTNQLNGGIEFGFLNGRITGEVSAYRYVTHDLLSDRSLPASSGFTTFKDNIGVTSTNGYEVSLTGHIIRDTNRGITWSVTGMLSYSNSIIEELSDGIKAEVEDYLNQEVRGYDYNETIRPLLYEGDAVNSLYLVQSIGIDPATGMELMLDKNGNVVRHYAMSDRQYVGIQGTPYRGNISSMFQYKDFSLNLNFGFHFGGVQLNETVLNKVEITAYDLVKSNFDRRVLEDTWQEVGDIVPFLGITPVSNATRATTRLLYDDTMFSLQSASAQYRWATKGLRKATGFESIRFGLNMSDIFYISTLKRERGTSYPFARRAELSVNITF